MTIALRPLGSLDPVQVGNNLALVTQSVGEAQPSLDLRRGVLSELLLYIHSLLTTQTQENVTDYLSARSVLDIGNDPTLADPAIVAATASNFLVTPQAASAASGPITVVVSADVTVTIPAGAVFTASGQTFITDQTYTAKVQASQIAAPGDVLITLVGNGTFMFTVHVVAQTPGSAGNIVANTLAAPAVVPVNFLTAYAAASFTGGIDADTNAQIIAKLPSGVAAAGLSGRSNMASLLLKTPAFAGVAASSAIGFGDAEMLRDRHWIWPISGGGRVDWYVRTAQLYSKVNLSKTATLIAINSDGTGTWQFSLAANDAPGFFEVTSILPATLPLGQQGFLPSADIRGIDLTKGTGLVPDVANAVEGAYSRFQTAVIQFIDTLTPVGAIGSLKQYSVTVSYLPLIDQIQALASSRGVSSFGADCLVKAPVPCFVQATCTLTRSSSDAAAPVAALQTAMAAAVNGVGFTGQLLTSLLAHAAKPLLTGTMTVSGFEILGRLRYPNGTPKYIIGPDVITVPADPVNLVSARTVQFFVQPADITINVVTVN
jgi:hypothetical protein